MKYIKLSKAVDGHGYITEYYTQEGALAKTETTELSKIDKLVNSKHKLRCKVGQEWGLLVIDRSGAVTSILPTVKPKNVV